MKLNKLQDVIVNIESSKKRRDALRSERKELKKELKDLKCDIELKEKVNLVFEYLINKKYDKVIELFEGTITSALVDSFDENYEFKFAIGKRGDSTTCDFEVNTGKGEGFKDVVMCEGNSLAQIIGTIMRIVLTKLDKQADYIILDEPFGGVEPERQVVVAELLNKVCSTFGMQMINVTQSVEFANSSDNVIELYYE